MNVTELSVEGIDKQKFGMAPFDRREIVNRVPRQYCPDLRRCWMDGLHDLVQRTEE